MTTDMLVQVSVDALRSLAKARHDLHMKQATHRPLSEDYEFVGLLGEQAFSRWSNIPMDLTMRVDIQEGKE